MNARLGVALEKGRRSLRAAESWEDGGTFAFGAHCDIAITRFFLRGDCEPVFVGRQIPDGLFVTGGFMHETQIASFVFYEGSVRLNQCGSGIDPRICLLCVADAGDGNRSQGIELALDSSVRGHSANMTNLSVLPVAALTKVMCRQESVGHNNLGEGRPGNETIFERKDLTIVIDGPRR